MLYAKVCRDNRWVRRNLGRRSLCYLFTVIQHRNPTLSERRAELDRLLRQELERQGIVVTGRDIARVVGSAVGKGIEWQA